MKGNREYLAKNDPEMTAHADGLFSWPLARWELCNVRSPRYGIHSAFRLIDPGAEVRQWRPLAEAPRLYREAAALPLDNDEALLEWVNHRGMLWPHSSSDPRVSVVGSLLVDGRPSSAAFVPPLEVPAVGPAQPSVSMIDVQAELDTLGTAVHVLDALRDGGSVLRLDSKPPAVDGLPLSEWVQKLSQGPKMQREWHLAWQALVETVANHLTLMMTLLPLPLGTGIVSVARKGHGLVMLPAPKLRPVLRPTTLASCLWWQFYQDAFGEKEVRMCRGCGGEFFPSRRDQWWHRRCYKRDQNRRARAALREAAAQKTRATNCLLYTSPSPRDLSTSRMPSSA